MKKILLTILLGLLMTGCSLNFKTEPVEEVISEATNEIDVLTLFSSKSKSKNRAWVGTFQLVFNDMKNNIIKRNIKFENEKLTSELVGLNKEEFKKSMLNESSYYTSWGETSPEAKEKIKKEIYDKFKENSDILDSVNWSKEPGKNYAYAMLKKEFEFFSEFDKLTKSTFNKSQKEYEFFGVTKDSKNKENIAKNVGILFYNHGQDYAVQLLTKTNDVIYLYRTESEDSFKDIWEKMLKNSQEYKWSKVFDANDTLKVPNLKFNVINKYPQLCNKTIVGTNMYFSEAIETLQLELNNKGGKVKSEALIMQKQNSIVQIEPKEAHDFNFDKTFIVFMVDADKKDPYLALRIKDLKEFQK